MSKDAQSASDLKTLRRFAAQKAWEADPDRFPKAFSDYYQEHEMLLVEPRKWTR
jgi:hypothetical protein